MGIFDFLKKADGKKTDDSWGDLIDAVRQVLLEIEEKRGSFALVAFQQTPEDFGRYMVSVSAPWITNADEAANMIGGAIENQIPNELLDACWSGVRAVRVDDKWVQDLLHKIRTPKFERLANMFFIAPGLRFNNTYIIGKGTRVQEAIIALDIETLESNAM